MLCGISTKGLEPTLTRGRLVEPHTLVYGVGRARLPSVHLYWFIFFAILVKSLVQYFGDFPGPIE